MGRRYEGCLGNTSSCYSQNTAVVYMYPHVGLCRWCVSGSTHRRAQTMDCSAMKEDVTQTPVLMLRSKPHSHLEPPQSTPVACLTVPFARTARPLCDVVIVPGKILHRSSPATATWTSCWTPP